MSYDVGSFVSFFSIDESFENINLNLIEDYIDDLSWYEIVSVNNPNDDFITVRSLSQGEDIVVLKDEYQIHTKESLRNYLNELLKYKEVNKKYYDICKKINQLYRKQEFKFQGVYS
jgi:hypothetical protein